MSEEGKKYFVYILYSSSLGKYYTGHTNDLEDRVYRHNSFQEKYTKIGAPWILIWNKEFSTRSEAMKVESQIKKRGAKRYLDGLIN